ncbi:hypothetical protein HHI36_017903 [Cryptolaemus montrouzieri]|uniref:Saccharopine dehydrogenase NADP binding domain-containing protein n=1 Tax=Cryptolaemus montrouzieri TaxID=559131 RepID=A0ABD2NPY5_9CUCU
MAERLDVLLFGVTGLVGRYGVIHLCKLASQKRLTWGVAGRDEERIKDVLQKLKEKTGDKTIADIPIIFGDMYNEESIYEMTSKTKVLINACGPLRSIGEIVVKACISTKTHYVDVSAEENFIDKILVKYHEKAREAGVYIVNACGVDCIAYDLGILYLQKKFPGTLNSVETFLRMDTDDSTLPGPSYNNSTWKSTIDLMLNKSELKDLKKKLPDNLPKLRPELSAKALPFKPRAEDGWAVVLTGSDRTVMLRTQQYLYEEKKIRPVQIQTYYILKQLWHILVFIFFGIMFSILVQFEAGRKLLMKYPYFFSCGMFGVNEPSEIMCEKAWFRLTMIGKGWGVSETKFAEEPHHGMVVQVKGKNPGYGATSLCLVLAGIVLATETAHLPRRYGVYTPGIVFGNTSLRKQLGENGVTFEVIDEFKL